MHDFFCLASRVKREAEESLVSLCGLHRKSGLDLLAVLRSALQFDRFCRSILTLPASPAYGSHRQSASRHTDSRGTHGGLGVVYEEINIGSMVLGP